MSLFSRGPNVVLYIHPHSLDMIFMKGGQVVHLDFPTTILNNLEIYDQLGFEKHIDRFLKNNNLKKQEAAILLSEDLVFEKRFPKTEKLTDETVQDFIDKIPLKPSEIIKKTILLAAETLVIATNQDVFQVLINVLTKNQWTVKSVIPIHAAPALLGTNQLNISVLRTLLKNEKQVNVYNMLEQENKDTEQSSGISLFWIIGAVILILGVIGFFILESMGMVKIPSVSLPTTTQVTPTATTAPILPTKKPSPTIAVDRSDYEITVLNGSGIAGEAKLLQEQLEDQDFIINETGNADKSDYQKSVISAKETVSKAFIDELEIEIAKLYVLEEEVIILAADSEEDIVITIGQEQNN